MNDEEKEIDDQIKELKEKERIDRKRKELAKLKERVRPSLSRKLVNLMGKL